MKPLQWILLCAIFALYLLFGGSIFMVLEQNHEKYHKEEMSVLRHDIQEILLRLDRDFYHNDTSAEVLDALNVAKEGVITRISEACGGNDFLQPSEISNDTPLRWNYYNSVFYAFTVITTIGYGHLSPQTHWSKIFTMCYALVGIPINGILICGLGDYFSSKLVSLHKRSKEKKYKGTLTLVLEITFYLIPGLIVFLIIPAGIFVLTESWTFLDSFYYAFITLTTIGFGDFVAGMGDGHNVWLWIYKVFIIVWITFGLGYLVMILGFITKGLKKSKKVRVVIEKRLYGIRSTKEKLTRDVEYMRKVVNELYLMKVQPIYEDGCYMEDIECIKNKKNVPVHLRTYSQPCILNRKYSSLPLPRRGHQFNESYSDIAGTRTMSETDLDIIDKEQSAVWARERFMDSAEILASVVTALRKNTLENVMQAVDQLNRYEEEVLAEGVTRKHNESRQVQENPVPQVVAIEDWHMDMVDESDEDVLIVSDDENNCGPVRLAKQHSESQLEQVIVHKNPEQSKNSSKSGIMGKVTEAIRKISTGTKGSEPSSRKTSKNETERRRKISRQTSRDTEGLASRKISSNESPERKISGQKMHYQHVHYSDEDDELSGQLHGQGNGDSLNDHHIRSCQGHGYPSPNSALAANSDNNACIVPMTTVPLRKEANGTQKQNNRDRKKKSSEISQVSSVSTFEDVACSPSSRRRQSILSDVGSRRGSMVNGRKMTPDSFQLTNRRLSAEQTSLAHFLKALDAVHEKLNAVVDGAETSDSCSSTDSSYYPSRKLSYKGQSSPRHRKMGVFNPEFSFVNNAFATDSDIKIKTKECIEK